MINLRVRYWENSRYWYHWYGSSTYSGLSSAIFNDELDAIDAGVENILKFYPNVDFNSIIIDTT